VNKFFMRCYCRRIFSLCKVSMYINYLELRFV